MTDELSEPTERWPQRHHRVVTAVGFMCVGVGLLLFWHGFHIEGHGSGDDFSLYINQARSLVHGDVGGTLAGNHYAVDNSAWRTFSPYAYPWGLPLLLAPVMAVTGTLSWDTGIDYAPLKLVVNITLAVALIAYFAICRRRMHALGALLLPLFFATNFWFVTHTDQVLSEFPFLMGVMLFVWWADRVREREQLDGDRRAPLVVLGLIACYAFNTRREGLGTMIGILAMQLVLAWDRTAATSWSERWRNTGSLNWKALATPWITFLGAAAAFQVALPSDLLPNYGERSSGPGTSFHNLGTNLRAYRRIVAEQLGLKDAGPHETTLFGSPGLGNAALITFVVAVGVGVVACAITARRRDAAIIGTFVGVGGAVAIAPYYDYRYIMGLMPVLVYFAYQGVTIPVRSAIDVISKPVSVRLAAWPVLVAELAVVGFMIGGWHDTKNAYDYRSGWVGPQSGPQEALSLEMWQAVRRETRGDDVIVFNRARTMGLYTSRLSVQGGALDFTLRSGDFYVMYLNGDGTPGDYSQYPLTDAEAAEFGLTEVWRNAGYVIWRLPDSASQ
ncbi:MAG TPA: hypothetical protein VMM60_02875 [Ilumatobacter sp.]|nr:hypothetical protein [Ilumatobacter sp.]